MSTAHPASPQDAERLREALRVAERRLAEAQHLARTGSWELDLRTGVLWWSDETYRIVGLDPQGGPASYDAFLALVHPDDRDAVHRAYTDSVERRTAYEVTHRLVRPDGRVRHVREVGRTEYDATGTPLRSLGAVQDITDLVTAEEAHRASEERLNQAMSIARVGIFDQDHRGGTTYWSPRQREIYGLDPDAPVTAEHWVAMAHPDDVARLTEALGRARDPAGDGRWNAEHRIIRADGQVRWLVSRSQTVFAGEGGERRPVRTIGAALDVTDLRTADEARRLKDEAIANALTAIAITDAEGRIIYVNPAFVRLWGYDSEADILGRWPTDFADPEATLRVIGELRERGSFQGDLVGVRRDGTRLDLILSASAIRDATGRITHLMGSFLDVSEAKRLQGQLLQAQKMESVGRLAGGVAHDFNNLLTVMRGYVDMALAAVDPRDPLHHDLGHVSAAIDSAATLTQQLLAFSRKQVISPQVLNLNDVIARIEPMLRRLLGEHVALRTIAAPGVGHVRFDHGQCEQIIINLAVNARDAMPRGGTVTIETANVHLDEAYASTHPDVQPGPYVMLAVSDTGTGMDAMVQAHLFEPFFTTKAQGRGTGLGLPMVFGAVSQNGGRLEVYSEVGHGTTFKIYLPRVGEPASAPAAVPQAVAGGGETVVLVEDEAAVRTLASRVLERQGYRVHAFADGPSALRAVAGTDTPIHLLVTDVVMPDMNGRVLAEKLAQLRPGMRVLFTSGYTENVVAIHGVLKPGVEFLAKPYSVEALARRVREVLEPT